MANPLQALNHAQNMVAPATANGPANPAGAAHLFGIKLIGATQKISIGAVRQEAVTWPDSNKAKAKS